MIFIDTNLLLHSVNRDSTDHVTAKECLESLLCGSERLCLSWAVVYEFLRVATHPRVFPKPLSLDHALDFLARLWSSENCVQISETSEHSVVLKQCVEELPRLAGNILHDLHIAVLMREHNVRQIVTWDRDFKTFAWVRIRSPQENQS